MLMCRVHSTRSCACASACVRACSFAKHRSINTKRAALCRKKLQACEDERLFTSGMPVQARQQGARPVTRVPWCKPSIHHLIITPCSHHLRAFDSLLSFE